MSSPKLIEKKIMQKLQKMHEGTCNKQIIRKLLIKDFQERYSELKSKPSMPTFLAFEIANFNCPLFYETSLVHISHQINIIINKNRVNREPYTKNAFR